MTVQAQTTIGKMPQQLCRLLSKLALARAFTVRLRCVEVHQAHLLAAGRHDGVAVNHPGDALGRGW
jgi:hypothetical protein